MSNIKGTKKAGEQMLRERREKLDIVILEHLVPKDHLLRRIR